VRGKKVGELTKKSLKGAPKKRCSDVTREVKGKKARGAHVEGRRVV